MEDQRGWLGTKSKCSPRPPLDIHITFGPRWKEIKANMFWALDSDCMTEPTCNGRHDLIRTPFGTLFIWLERKFHRASNGIGLMSKTYLRQRGNHRNKWTSRICQSAASPSFGPSAHVSCRSPWGRDLGLEQDPNQVLVMPLPSHIPPLPPQLDRGLFFVVSLAIATSL
jgi:hypothetical protein